MEELQAKVVEQLERMKLDAEALQEKGIKFYVLHAECAVNLATWALELLEDYAERWDEFQVDMLTAFAERLKNHYPHTVSIQNTIDKELQAFTKGKVSRNDEI